MFLRYLLSHRSAAVDADLSFRTRGSEVSRIEGFSDTVFGFAITLLVISTQIPATIADLLAMGHAVLPFIASFFILFMVWRAQFDFFRRYGLEDRQTVRLTGLLMMIVLLGVYPVRFLCTFVLDVLPFAMIAGNDSMRAMMSLGDVPKVLLAYGIGLWGIAFVFSRLYRHAATLHATLGLSELELFDTRAIGRRWLGMSLIGVAIVAWCVGMLLLGDHIARRDLVWRAGYFLGWAGVAAVGAVQRRAIRRLARDRQLLSAAAPAAPI
jgi:uncharacterized membrane protein